jgi:hypothetical protein
MAPLADKFNISSREFFESILMESVMNVVIFREKLLEKV